MFNLDNITTKNNNKDWPYRKLIIGPSRSAKTNYLLNSIQKENNIIDKIYFCTKDLEEPKYQFLIEKREKAGLKYLNDKNLFNEHSNTMDDIYESIEDYNKKRKRKVLIVFYNMISHVMSDKKAQQVLKSLFIRCRKLNISISFLIQSYFRVPKDVRLNCSHYIIFKLSSKRELQNIAINHSTDSDYKDFIKIYRNCTEKPYHVLTIDTAQSVDEKLIIDRMYRQNAKISALSSGNLDKYEYLSGEALRYRPDLIQQKK